MRPQGSEGQVSKERAAPESVLDWLLSGDVSIQYLARRDLLDDEEPRLRARIAREGWGARFLAHRNPDGTWGRGFYQPKWTNSHYTLLDLRTLAAAPDHPLIRESVHKIAREEKAEDGGICPAESVGVSDVCVTGMFLNYASYFGEPEAELRSIVDFLLQERMGDGGFNCYSNRSGARHSSLHSTLSVIEGVNEYARNGYRYRRRELEQAAADSQEFILLHRLFKSDHTGAVIRKDFLRFSFPPRWKYNILRALDYFQAANVPWDERMADAAAVVLAKRNRRGRWPLPAAHPGEVHFKMEVPGKESRWNTLLALRVVRAYGAHFS
jgi:hypothetical protein